MSESTDFEPLGRITVDDRRRVPLGQTDTVPGARFTVFQRADGAILLRPAPGNTTQEAQQ